MDFSLYYFSARGDTREAQKYELMIRTARFADARGFSAVWTPERHFQPFGGLFPNPSLTSAALAMVTERVGIRAGSFVLPLHNVVRAVEEWSMVDNLSNGRVGISFATGWHPADFVLAPDAHQDRDKVLLNGMAVMQQLWAGEEVWLPGPDQQPVRVTTYPVPIQPTLPTWITTSGNPETCRLAGRLGLNLFTGLLGQTVESLRANVAIYREALIAAGHDPATKAVTVAVHTYLGSTDQSVREVATSPMREYLSTFMRQFSGTSRGAKAGSDGHQHAQIDFAVERYMRASMLGSPDKCARVVERLRDMGVTEIACLIDWGIDLAGTLASLELLDTVRNAYAS